MIISQDMLDNWLKCQSTWLYLEPIFSSDDIVKQMPEEGEKFRQVDSAWRAIQQSTHERPNAIEIAQDVERLDKLVRFRSMLRQCIFGLGGNCDRHSLTRLF